MIQEQRVASLAWQVEEVETTLILRLGLTVRRRDTSSLASADTAPRPALSCLVKPWGPYLLFNPHLIDCTNQQLVFATVLLLFKGQLAREPALG